MYKEELGEFTIDYDLQDEDGNNFLHYLVQEFFEEKIQKDIPQNSPLLEKKNNKGETPLFVAVTLQDEEIMQILLDKGADINSLNN